MGRNWDFATTLLASNGIMEGQKKNYQKER
jgi:hypothetical protein